MAKKSVKTKETTVNVPDSTVDNPVVSSQKKTEKSSQSGNAGGTFKKGHKKVGGRKAGTKNKMTTDIRKILQEQLMPHIMSIGNVIEKIADPADKSAAIAHWANYLIPKYSNTTINGDTRRDIGTEELLKQLDEQYQKSDIEIDVTKIKIVNNQ